MDNNINEIHKYIKNNYKINFNEEVIDINQFSYLGKKNSEIIENINKFLEGKFKSINLMNYIKKNYFDIYYSDDKGYFIFQTKYI